VNVDIARAWLKASPEDAVAREALDDAKLAQVQVKDDIDAAKLAQAQVKVDNARARWEASPQDAGAREALDDAKLEQAQVKMDIARAQLARASPTERESLESYSIAVQGYLAAMKTEGRISKPFPMTVQGSLCWENPTRCEAWERCRSVWTRFTSPCPNFKACCTRTNLLGVTEETRTLLQEYSRCVSLSPTSRGRDVPLHTHTLTARVYPNSSAVALQALRPHTSTRVGT